MNDLAERILYIRKEKGLSQSAFGEALNLSQNFVWMMESGKRSPSDRTVSDICRIFGVNEVWLRTGKGQPFAETPADNQITASLAEAAARKENAKQRILRALASMPEEYFPAMEAFIMSWITDNKDKFPPQQPPQP